MKIEDIEKLLQSNQYDFDVISEKLAELKKIEVENNNQDKAKYLWCLEQINKIKKLFASSFELLKKSDFEQSWYTLDRCDIELSFLRPHFDYSNNIYNLDYIEKQIPKYQELFPYDYFSSRESIESDFTCSICNQKMGIRAKGCTHKVGEIYDGEMCFRIVNKIEFLGIAIVKKPFDKYTILQVEGVEYNYHLLKTLMEYLESPFEEWGYEIEYQKWDFKKDPRYSEIERNDKCICGSGKKFKYCCLLKNEEIKHYKFWGSNDNFQKSPIQKTTFRTKI